MVEDVEELAERARVLGLGGEVLVEVDRKRRGDAVEPHERDRHLGAFLAERHRAHVGGGKHRGGVGAEVDALGRGIRARAGRGGVGEVGFEEADGLEEVEPIARLEQVGVDAALGHGWAFPLGDGRRLGIGDVGGVGHNTGCSPLPGSHVIRSPDGWRTIVRWTKELIVA